MGDDLVARRRALLRAVLTVIDELPEADLLQAVTPERVGAHLGYSASSVRYQFAQLFGSGDGAAEAARSGPAPRWSFDRKAVLEALVEEIEVRTLETAAELRDFYLAAIEAAIAARSAEPLVEAVARDLASYAQGATDSSANLSERSYLLAATACDRSSALGRRLRAMREQELDLYVPIYDAGLRATGRRPRPGVPVRAIADAVAQLIEGACVVRRYRPPGRGTDLVTAQGMLAVFIGMTEPDPGRDGAPLRHLT